MPLEERHFKSLTLGIDIAVGVIIWYQYTGLLCKKITDLHSSKQRRHLKRFMGDSLICLGLEVGSTLKTILAPSDGDLIALMVVIGIE
jgi:hypothetical protein